MESAFFQHQAMTCVYHAGPERSGSTWLFNAVRLLFEDAQEPLDAFWVTHLTDAALDARGCGACCSSPRNSALQQSLCFRC